jgi:hypothetical protein
MGETLAAFRELPIEGVEIDRSWADAAGLAARAAEWTAALEDLADSERVIVAGDLARVPELFRGRPVVLSHGDFSPVNVLSDGSSVTGRLILNRSGSPTRCLAWRGGSGR